MSFTFAASVPTALAIRPARIWSVLAIEPPAQDTEPGSAFSLVTRSASRLDRQLSRDDEDLVLAHQPRQWRDVVEGHRRLVRNDGSLKRLTSDQDRVTSGASWKKGLGKPDRSPGTGDVLHLNTGCKTGLLKHSLYGARGLIPTAAGISWSNQVQFLDFGRGCCGRQHQGSKCGNCGQVHDGTS